MDTIIDQDELKEARKQGLDEMEKLAAQLAKRAKKPAYRQAMAEVEETLEKVKADWRARGWLAA